MQTNVIFRVIEETLVNDTLDRCQRSGPEREVKLNISSHMCVTTGVIELSLDPRKMCSGLFFSFYFTGF